MSGRLEITLLGTGSSGGVPRADGNWGVCDPAEPRNRRTRCSMLVRRLGDEGGGLTTVVVDTSPDFRLQMAEAGARRLDAVLYTHDHADQCHGIDDIRAFAMTAQRRAPCYMDPATYESLTQRFRYIFFGEQGYPAICEAHPLPPWGEPFQIGGPSGPVPVTTFEQEHGPISSVGYRFGGVAYSSDVSGLSDKALASLENLDVWIVDALRLKPHPTHANLDQALRWIEQLKPARAVLTNMHVDMDYATLSAELPPGVEAGYDGWRAEVDL